MGLPSVVLGVFYGKPFVSQLTRASARFPRALVLRARAFRALSARSRAPFRALPAHSAHASCLALWKLSLWLWYLVSLWSFSRVSCGNRWSGISGASGKLSVFYGKEARAQGISEGCWTARAESARAVSTRFPRASPSETAPNGQTRKV